MPIGRRATLFGLLGPLLPLPALAAGPDAIARYEAACGGHVGVYARNLVTGASLSWRADDRFAMCSSFKASLAALVLARVDRGLDSLSAPVRLVAADVPDWYAPVARARLGRGAMSVGEMAAAAVEQSDNTCATLLLDRVGGPAALTAFWRATGDAVSRLDDPEPLLNVVPTGGVRNTTTPRAMADTIVRLVLGDVLRPGSRALLRGWMIGCTTGLDRLRAGLPHDWIVGDKTGHNGRDAAGDIALAWPAPGSDRPIVVCAYTRGGTPNETQLARVFAAIGRLAASRLA